MLKFFKLAGVVIAGLVSLAAILSLVVGSRVAPLEVRLDAEVLRAERLEHVHDELVRDVDLFRESQIRTEEAIKRIEEKLDRHFEEGP